VTFSFNPRGHWTASHQMSLNGKRQGFTMSDFHQCAKLASMKRGRATTILEEVCAATKRWPEFSAEAKVSETWRSQIQRSHLLSFPA
ncbi:MAG TPA: type II toxin-antitoxin system HipA family toxin, partial [Polyangia bacterium]